MNATEIQERIDRLIPHAETGEQWAEICRLEALMIEVAEFQDFADDEYEFRHPN